MMKPAPAHRPWSGGSKRALKLVNSLSLLLVPLKLDSSDDGSVATVDAAAGGAADDADAEAWRAPCGRADTVVGPDALPGAAPGRTPVATRRARAGDPD